MLSADSTSESEGKNARQVILALCGSPGIRKSWLSLLHSSHCWMTTTINDPFSLKQAWIWNSRKPMSSCLTKHHRSGTHSSSLLLQFLKCGLSPATWTQWSTRHNFQLRESPHPPSFWNRMVISLLLSLWTTSISEEHARAQQPQFNWSWDLGHFRKFLLPGRSCSSSRILPKGSVKWYQVSHRSTFVSSTLEGFPAAHWMIAWQRHATSSWLLNMLSNIQRWHSLF